MTFGNHCAAAVYLVSFTDQIIGLVGSELSEGNAQ